VKGYRSSASGIIKRTYAQKLDAIRAKYEPQISATRKKRSSGAWMPSPCSRIPAQVPSDRKWTPDVMFRLAELYYEKAADEFLAAQESTKRRSIRTIHPPRPRPSLTTRPR